MLSDLTVLSPEMEVSGLFRYDEICN